MLLIQQPNLITSDLSNIIHILNQYYKIYYSYQLDVSIEFIFKQTIQILKRKPLEFLVKVIPPLSQQSSKPASPSHTPSHFFNKPKTPRTPRTPSNSPLKYNSPLTPSHKPIMSMIRSFGINHQGSNSPKKNGKSDLLVHPVDLPPFPNFTKDDLTYDERV